MTNHKEPAYTGSKKASIGQAAIHNSRTNSMVTGPMVVMLIHRLAHNLPMMMTKTMTFGLGHGIRLIAIEFRRASTFQAVASNLVMITILSGTVVLYRLFIQAVASTLAMMISLSYT